MNTETEIELEYEKMTGEEFRKIYKGLGMNVLVSVDYEKISNISSMIEETLNLHLAITNYSSEVKEYIFVFIAVNPLYGLPRADKVQFLRSLKAVRVFMNMSKENLEKSDNELIRAMCELYLQSIKTYLSKRKDFLADAFYADVKNLFVEKKWIENENR